LSIAFDTGGVAAVREYIRPAQPLQMAPEILDIMGWNAAEYARAAAPTYPNLIDEQHIVAELYNMNNVPMAVWIDERGHIVRPAEPAGASDGFRTMDRATFKMAKEVADQGRITRKRYVDALRDWVAKGDASEYVLSPEEIRARIHAPSDSDAMATANFRLGQWLYSNGHADAAHRYLVKARELSPERWHYFRQTLELEEVGKASGPQFFGAVDALGNRPYYPPIELKSLRK
jgi:hypothetical protein